MNCSPINSIIPFYALVSCEGWTAWVNEFSVYTLNSQVLNTHFAVGYHLYIHNDYSNDYNMSLVTSFRWSAYHVQRNASHYKATMHVFVPWKYICVTIVQMKCTHANFVNTELKSRHNKALSVVHTHTVHRYSQVESTKRYSPHYTHYIRILAGHPMVCASPR